MSRGLSYDRNGVPGFRVDTDMEAYWSLGFLHGFHRPLQSLLLGTAGRGQLSERLFPLPALVSLDALSHRLDLPRRGETGARQLSVFARERVDQYLGGLACGVREAPTSLERASLVARLAAPDPATLVSGLLLSAYLGLAGGQERMEQALVDALRAGADPACLEAMFSPHLAGWDPRVLRAVPRVDGLGLPGYGGQPAVGGSNAFAMRGGGTRSGYPLLAGDPHLQVNQIPSLFIEVRARVGQQIWLGASIPGLPALAVGRNRDVAWSGTFSVADNVDFSIESIRSSSTREPEGGDRKLDERVIEIRRRFRPPLLLRFYDGPRGVVAWNGQDDGLALSSRWAALDSAPATIDAYMRLPWAKSAEEAEKILRSASTLSLHYVLADRSGDVRYCQAGAVPVRTGGWSGLFPVSSGDKRRWAGLVPPASLPRQAGLPWAVTANEGRLSRDGRVLSTLAQPTYRLNRITELLVARGDHDVASFQAIQRDLYSRQGLRFQSFWAKALPAGPLKDALLGWDFRCDAESKGAHAFCVAHSAALQALGAELGGAWFQEALEDSEVGLWWSNGLDRLLASPSSWVGDRGQRLMAALAGVKDVCPSPWGEVQTLEFSHLLFGFLPGAWGVNRGPYPLPGSPATVSQASTLRVQGQRLVIAPAYRFVCDLGEDAAYSSLPGGVDGSCFAPSYDRFIHEYLSGRYHRIVPPGPGD